MRIKNHIILLVAALLFALTINWIVPEPARAQEKITLKFYHAMSGGKGKCLETLVDKFNKENSDIQIEPVQVLSPDPQTGNDYHALYKSILENIAMKTPPDIAQVYENWTVQLIEINALTPVEDYVGKEIPQAEIEDLVLYMKKGNTFDGKLWTMPFNKSIFVLYYNKDIFDKAGMKAPETWEEFRTTCAKLTSQKDGRYGFCFSPSVDIFGHYLYAYDGEFMKDNQAAFNTEIGMKDMKFWVDLVNSDKSAKISFTDMDDFKNQKSAMYIGTTSQIGKFKNSLKFNWGTAILPKGTVRRYQSAGTNLAIFSHLSPEKRLAAVKFISFLTSKESTTYWALHTGYLPVRKSAITSPEYKALLKSDPRFVVGITALHYTAIQPKVASWEIIRGLLDDAMFSAVSRRCESEVALRRAAQAADNLMKNMSQN